MIKTALLALLALSCFGPSSLAQQPAPAPPPSESTPAPTTNSSQGIPTRSLPGFLIIGTVFNENALSFPGVEVKIRRVGDKRYKWDTTTNSRGEFAVRVPQGTTAAGQQYEVFVHVKKYKDHVEKVTTVNGDIQQRLSIRLELADSGKKGAKS